MTRSSIRSILSAYSLNVHANDNANTIESKAIYYAVTTGIISYVVAVIVYYGSVVPIFGRGSIGVTAGLLGVVATFIAYFLAKSTDNSKNKAKKPRGFWPRAHLIYTNCSLALVYAFIALLVYTAFFFILQDAFKGLAFDSWSASIFIALSVAVGSYVAFLSSVEIGTQKLSSLLAVFLVSGSLTSMITAEDPQWWQYHFSSLGGGDSLSSHAFNITLILGGGVIVALADAIANDFGKMPGIKKSDKAVRVTLIRSALIAIGICLAFVGIFAYDTSTTIHNASAGAMALIFIGLIGSLPFIAPVFSRAFYILSYSMMGGLIVAYWLFEPVGYLNLTAFELTAAATIFSWLAVFIRQITASINSRPKSW